jgi:hypothetical protein
LRREGRDAPPVPVCSCARSYAQIAHGTAGAACTRSSLRPPILEGKRRCKPRARCVARTRSRIHRHCLRQTRGVCARERSDEAIHLSACRAMDCFAALAMTGLGDHTATSCSAAALARFGFFTFDGPNSEPAARPAVSATPGSRDTMAATMAPSISNAS